MAQRSVFYTPAQQKSLARLLPDLVRSRELLLDLVSKELRVRYRVASMGFFWAVLQPLLMMAILGLVFGVILDSRLGLRGADPYAVSLLCALIPWQFLASSLTAGTNSLVDNQELVKKVYFPREVVPIATVLDWFVNFLIGAVLLIILHLLFGGYLHVGMFWLPVVFVIQFTLVLGLVLLLSSLNVFFRDVRYIIDTAVVFGFYATPVFYEFDKVQDALGRAEPFYLLNPMVGLVTVYRHILFDHPDKELVMLVWPIVFAILSLVVGAIVFRRNASTLADHL